MKTVHKTSRLGTVALALLMAAAACRTPETPAARADAPALASALKATLAKERRLADGTNVDVNPRTGIVRLSGRVATKEDRAAAGRLASSVKGVTIVYNELEVAHATR